MAKSSTPFALPPGFTIRPATSTDRWGILKLYLAFFDRDSLLRSLIKGLNVSLSSFSYILLLVFGFFTSSIFIGYQIENFAQQWLWNQNGYFVPYNLPNNLMRILQNYAYLISFTFTTTTSLIGIFNFTKRSLPGVWVVECDRHIVAVARLSRSPQYSLLAYLYVAYRYRQRGLGSCLVQKLIQEANKPVFLFCLPELVGFYHRFGFIRPPKENVPLKLKFLNPRFTLLALVSRNSAVSPSPVPANKVDRLPNSPNRTYLIRQAQLRDAKKVQQVIFTSPNFDIFLPFGISLKILNLLGFLVTQSFISILIIATIILFGLAIIVLGYSNGSGSSSEMKNYEYFSWVLGMMLKLGIYYIGGWFVLMLMIIISGFRVSRQYSNFWLLERNSKIVGYARLSIADRYSILHYLHIDPEHLTQSLDREFIDRLSLTVRKPIYLACDAEFLQRYKRLGFIPVSTNSLPQKLRFGGILNQQFGGSNLVLR